MTDSTIPVFYDDESSPRQVSVSEETYADAVNYIWIADSKDGRPFRFEGPNGARIRVYLQVLSKQSVKAPKTPKTPKPQRELRLPKLPRTYKSKHSHELSGRGWPKTANATSIYDGVCNLNRPATRRNWQASIKNKYLGVFYSEEEAAMRVDQWKREQGLPETAMNFPTEVGNV